MKISEIYDKIYNDIKCVENSVIGVEGAMEILTQDHAIMTGRYWIMCPSSCVSIPRMKSTRKMYALDMACSFILEAKSRQRF